MTLPAAPRPNPAFTPDLYDRLAQLTLDDKCELLTGKTHWRLYARPQIGLREVVLSDGPTGIRGEEVLADERSVSLPSPTAVAATWDRELARLAGSVHAAEAHRHGTDVILTPVVNLQRTPVAGRHFEYQSEDPLLSGDIACAVIDGIQGEGVGTCVKHFVANDSETLRTEYLARVGERALREVYLAPFERACRDAHAWSVMGSYNRLDDGVESAPAVAHHRLLTETLKDEWGYDGPVVSDWTATKTTVEPAVGGLDLVMPGPAGPWSAGQLKAAVEAGLVSEDHLNDKVLRILLLASRVGALAGYPAPVPARAVADEAALIRLVAARAVVVLANEDDALPVAAPAGVRTIALIGPNAVDTYVQGGGSALVNPQRTYTSAEAFAEAFPGAAIEVVAGTHARVRPLVAQSSRLGNPAGGAGIRVEVLGQDGTQLAETVWEAGDIFARDGLPDGAWTVRLTTDVAVPEPGEHWVGVAAPGAHRVVVAGGLVSESAGQMSPDQVFLRSQHRNVPFYGTTVAGGGTVRVEAEVQAFEGANWGNFVRAVIHHNPPEPGLAEAIAAAAERAKAVDLPVVIVGTNADVESEGWDRPDLELPGAQNELVEAVLAVRPDAVIVVNAGSPVILPWLDRARTVLWTWFPGQEGGRPVADVLVGRTEPSGRLPWTLPASYADVPVPNAVPVGEDLVVDYAEGIDVGYRGWLRLGRVPARPFGFGLGWTTWEYEAAGFCDAGGDDIGVEVTIRNTGGRRGRETVQVFLAVGDDQGDEPVRPVRWLAGFGAAEADPGESAGVRVTVPLRAFQVWDEALATWVVPGGTYRLLIGRDLDDIRCELTQTI
ncbi:MAG: glycoside hydrolase family 3 C-terminal domain-containing protein [Propionibacteriaceae bacterium]|jgi:beta-glucosidase|nr:glycoside hydrolase family 3 C-terminal domain-containing protein [Propionibacteriaceae bacterium]